MRKNKQKKSALNLCLALVSIMAIYAGCTAIAGASAELYLSPAIKTVNIGDNFFVDVLVNTSGQNVVVVAAYLNYDPTELKVVSINTSNSVFTMEIEKTADPTIGEIKITLGKSTPGVNTTRGNVATINFEALAQASPANVTFVRTSSDATGDSGIILDDVKGTDILSSVKNGTYFIVGETQINAELSLSPATTTVDVGDIFNVDVLVNTGGQNVVVVGAYLTYDATKLEIVDINGSNSVLTEKMETGFDSQKGTISIVRYKPTPGVNTTNGNVATIKFKALAEASQTNVAFVMMTPVNAVDSDVILERLSNNYQTANR